MIKNNKILIFKEKLEKYNMEKNEVHLQKS